MKLTGKMFKIDQGTKAYAKFREMMDEGGSAGFKYVFATWGQWNDIRKVVMGIHIPKDCTYDEIWDVIREVETIIPFCERIMIYDDGQNLKSCSHIHKKGESFEKVTMQEGAEIGAFSDSNVLNFFTQLREENPRTMIKCKCGRYMVDMGFQECLKCMREEK